MPRALGLCSLLMAVVLVACTVPANRNVPDRAPPDIDPAAVPDAIPQADTITRAGNSSPYTVNGQSYWVLASARGYRERGIASWYGLKFHGRPTANGERFSVYGPTAAHRSLPIPTYVRVTNEGNGASMVLRVNDRGPFHSDRLIDLSYGAAVRLGFADKGTASVLVEAIDVPGMQDVRSDVANGYSRLQLGAFSTRSAAEALAQRARAVVSASVTVAAAGDAQTPLFRVRAGPFADALALEDARTRLRAAGLPEGQPIP